MIYVLHVSLSPILVADAEFSGYRNVDLRVDDEATSNLLLFVVAVP